MLCGQVRSAGTEVGPVDVWEHLLATDAAFIHLFESDAVLSWERTFTVAPEAHGLHRHAALSGHLRGATRTLDCFGDLVHAAILQL